MLNLTSTPSVSDLLLGLALMVNGLHLEVGFKGLGDRFMAIRSWQAVLTSIAITFGLCPSALAADAHARSTYNNKMALIGVLREGARQRAVEAGDLQTLCLILGIGLDVTDRYLVQAGDAGELLQRRQRMQADLNTCLQGLKSRN